MRSLKSLRASILLLLLLPVSVAGIMPVAYGASVDVGITSISVNPPNSITVPVPPGWVQAQVTITYHNYGSNSVKHVAYGGDYRGFLIAASGVTDCSGSSTQGITLAPGDTVQSYLWIVTTDMDSSKGNAPSQVNWSVSANCDSDTNPGNNQKHLSYYVYVAQAQTGTLSMDTAPVKGGVFVGGISWGIAPQSKSVLVGSYTVSFGAVSGYNTPASQNVQVNAGQTTSVLGTYTQIASCGSANGDLYTLSACAIAPSKTLVSRALLTFVSGGQSLTVSAGSSVSFTAGYSISRGSNPSELDQLLFLPSWAGWSPSQYWGVFNGIPAAGAGSSGSAPVSFTAPSTAGTYYLWLGFDANYGYAQAAKDFKNALSTPAMVKLTVTPSFDFGISVSPNSGSVVAGNALSPAGTITLTRTGGSAQSVSLSTSGLPSNVGVTGLSPTSCSPTCTSSFSIGTFSGAPAGTYTITITGTGGGKTHSTTYTLTVASIAGVKNVVTLNSGLSVTEPSLNCENPATTHCFSIQQNIAIQVPGSSGGYTYWAQDVLNVQQNVLGQWEAAAGFNVFNSANTIIACQPGIAPRACLTGLGFTKFTLPATFTMTSVISGNNLVMTNNFGSFTFKLASSSGNIIYTPSPYLNPELAIVGDRNGHQATFGSGTSGQVQSFLELSSGAWQNAASQTLLSLSNTQTGETSANLSWTITSGNVAIFAYKKGGSGEGICFWR